MNNSVGKCSLIRDSRFIEIRTIVISFSFLNFFKNTKYVSHGEPFLKFTYI